MKRVLILGGGFGGVATAHRLKQRLRDEVEVILVDRRPYFMVGFRKSWGLVGESSLEAGQRPLDRLTKIGIRVMRDEINSSYRCTRNRSCGPSEGKCLSNRDCKAYNDWAVPLSRRQAFPYLYH